MSRISHFFYNLFRKKRLEQWHKFLAVPQGYIRIILYLVHHGNKATKQQIIADLTELGGDSRNPESIERMVNYMKEKGFLIEKEFVLSLKNPEHYCFIIKWVRGNFLDRWFTATIPFAVLALIFNSLGVPMLTQIFLIIVLVLIILFIIDDFIHVQSW